jgi:predicted ATP-grasp superfamily ATP-dependent carboligase
LISRTADLKSIPLNAKYPLIIKGQDVNIWRNNIHRSIKGFSVNDYRELERIVKSIISEKVHLIIQEIIQGPDTNHYKYCVCTNSKGEIIAEFTLRKIRQDPIHFGVGAVVESFHYPHLLEMGRKLFNGIGFLGIGSAEFKLDERDGKLKLIEINPRYWQQNYLSTACGVNFPYIQYLDFSGKPVVKFEEFQDGIKWVNRYMDLNSFISYRKEGTLSFSDWRHSLKGKKVYSDFAWDDPVPALFEIGFGWKLIKIPWFIFSKLFK